MTAELRWTGESTSFEGIVERGFEVIRDGQPVPAVLWTLAERTGPSPLVLLGHGGGGNKRDEDRLIIVRDYIPRGWACAAIDAYGHGERALPEGQEPQFTPEVQDGMLADWQATLDVLCELDEIDETRVAYVGVSMGTMFGLPFVASEPRLRAAHLGLAGVRGNTERSSSILPRLGEFAPRVACPTMFIVQWDDEHFPRDGAFALFELIGAGDKRMHVHPGLHGEVPLHVADSTARFLATFLEGEGAG